MHLITVSMQYPGSIRAVSRPAVLAGICENGGYAPYPRYPGTFSFTRARGEVSMIRYEQMVQVLMVVYGGDWPNARIRRIPRSSLLCTNGCEQLSARIRRDYRPDTGIRATFAHVSPVPAAWPTLAVAPVAPTGQRGPTGARCQSGTPLRAIRKSHGSSPAQKTT